MAGCGDTVIYVHITVVSCPTSMAEAAVGGHLIYATALDTGRRGTVIDVSSTCCSCEPIDAHTVKPINNILCLGRLGGEANWE